MKQVRKTSLIVILIFLLFSCVNDNEVETETLAKVYVDLLLVEDIYFGTDSLNLKRNVIFENYGISEESYDSTFKIFEHNSEEWDKFFSLANAYLDTLKANQKKTEQKLAKPLQF